MENTRFVNKGIVKKDAKVRYTQMILPHQVVWW